MPKKSVSKSNKSKNSNLNKKYLWIVLGIVVGLIVSVLLVNLFLSRQVVGGSPQLAPKPDGEEQTSGIKRCAAVTYKEFPNTQGGTAILKNAPESDSGVMVKGTYLKEGKTYEAIFICGSTLQELQWKVKDACTESIPSNPYAKEKALTVKNEEKPTFACGFDITCADVNWPCKDYQVYVKNSYGNIVLQTRSFTQKCLFINRDNSGIGGVGFNEPFFSEPVDANHILVDASYVCDGATPFCKNDIVNGHYSELFNARFVTSKCISPPIIAGIDTCLSPACDA